MRYLLCDLWWLPCIRRIHYSFVLLDSSTGLTLAMDKVMDKGTLSNALSACSILVGIILPGSDFRTGILCAGACAFCAGITNSLAAKMLFDRVPGLFGSGVIPARFSDVRSKIVDLIMAHFFAPAHLRRFLSDRRADFDWRRYLKDGPSDPLVQAVKDRWRQLSDPQTIGPIIDGQLEKLMDSSIGGMLLMVGMDNVKPAVNTFVMNLVASLEEKVVELASKVGDSGPRIALDEEKLVADLEREVRALVKARLDELSPATVRDLLQDWIGPDLGWVVVWGNVLGGLLGLALFCAGKWLAKV